MFPDENDTFCSCI